MISSQFIQIISIAKKLAFIVGVSFLFFVFIELLQAFQVLSSLHPTVGWIFIGVIFCGVLWFIYRFRSAIRAFPRAITPPNPEEYNNSTMDKYNKAYIVYLRKYCNELLTNPELDDDNRNQLQNSIKSAPHPLTKDWLEVECISPMLLELNKKAEIIVRNTVRDTMTAVILSPFRSLDSFVVISRNAQMFMNLVRLYNHHPGIFQIGRYAKDVLIIVTSVNILNYTERLTENFMRNIPILNRTTDDVIQGVGAGILTTAVGRAAINRCRAYGVWDQESEKINFVKASLGFGKHVRGIFADDVLPSLGNLWTEAWKKVKYAYDKTIDKTQATTDFSKEKSNRIIKKLKTIRNPFAKNSNE
ncbi:MAG: DUF697 domain-containing protein [Candidatus Marinimicrobia bacterium]|nr:DUF697 domain-containing protein [Candidatus Neomarinimicrobiota bacterium]